MKNLAAYFGSQKLAPATAADKNLASQGERLYRGGNLANGVPACAGCHGPSGAGIPVQFPHLASQHAEYIEAELKKFRNGERTNDPGKMMQMIAAKMTDKEMKAVAEYIKGLR